MFKLIVLIKKKPGISRQEFIDHYEGHHARAVPKMLPEIFAKCRLYRRNYLAFNDPMGSIAGPEYVGIDLGFDVITELVFDTREEAEAMLIAGYGDPEKREIVRADGDKFVDNHQARFYVVEVHETKLGIVG